VPDILVMGAGAVGAYFGASLQRAGRTVAFVARGANLDALRTHGIRITGAMGDFELGDAAASDDPRTFESAKIVVLAVKAYDLGEAVRATDGLGEIYLTLQNGVDAPRVAREIVGDRVLAGTTGIVADLVEPGHVHVTSAYAWIRFGEPGGGGITERVRAVEAMLDVHGVEPIPAEDARVALWEKMALMCGMAGLTTLHQRPIGEVLGGDLRATFEAIVAECGTVARADGVPISDDFIEKRLGYADRIDPSAM
jgi:2-dehydropantoate 2-reductase